MVQGDRSGLLGFNGGEFVASKIHIGHAWAAHNVVFQFAFALFVASHLRKMFGTVKYVI